MGDRLVHRAAETPVIIDAGDQATVTQLHQAVAAQLGIAVDDGALTLDGWPLPDGLSLAAAGLVVGSAVGVGHQPDAGPATPGGVTEDLELAVVGGLGAGQAIPVPAGTTVTVGRGAGCELAVHDPEVSRQHTRVTVPEAVRRCSPTWTRATAPGPAATASTVTPRLPNTTSSSSARPWWRCAATAPPRPGWRSRAGRVWSDSPSAPHPAARDASGGQRAGPAAGAAQLPVPGPRGGAAAAGRR